VILAPYLLYVVAGKIAIFVLQRFPFKKLPLLSNLFAEGKFLQELFSCDLCLGVWVYTILAFFFKANIYNVFYIPFVSELLTGMTTSFILHVFSAGWQALFGVTVIGD
jgi:hypothetical protein